MPEENKSCLNCNKDDNRTGKPCPTRSGCFTPDYKNWEPVKDESGLVAEYTIKAFTFANDEFVVTLENKASGRSEIVEVTPADIMGLLKK